ncbi:hypothetical protein SAMN07250955_11614 [Arboricoccus pini]|uniref:N-acetyltransferase domain-containing protein n=1 Tax=Arboricoccus pini TaxID=1963835 RepID=A0A212RW92_9PROT|nr:GNAT family N-acetyltransferase [Arboricoccus pini]SNB77033.1 hypothetical protein SAMN07250955_11614 [Arboricoccus pini]
MSEAVALRRVQEADRPELLALNNAHAVELSYAEADEFARLLEMAFLASTSGEVGAPGSLLLALDQDAPCDGPNFRWFKARYARFVYVDRIVVAASAPGRGLAERHYAQLFAMAGKAGHTRIVCEVNSDPPNPISDAFHAKLGFEQVGEQWLSDRDKTVRYLCRPLYSVVACAC